MAGFVRHTDLHAQPQTTGKLVCEAVCCGLTSELRIVVAEHPHFSDLRRRCPLREHRGVDRAPIGNPEASGGGKGRLYAFGNASVSPLTGNSRIAAPSGRVPGINARGLSISALPSEPRNVR